MPMENLVVVCADIGSTAKGNFGWWSSAAQEGTLPSTLAAHVAALLNSRTPVALGFECPMFVPLAEDEMNLTKARPGDGTRAWSAGAGCGALATGLVQVAWVLRAIRCELSLEAGAYLDWEQFQASPSGLFIWEAFVSGPQKKDSHIADAQAGAEAFRDALPDPRSANAIKCKSVYSLVGAALLRTGWTSDLNVMSSDCLVLKAGEEINS